MVNDDNNHKKTYSERFEESCKYKYLSKDYLEKMSKNFRCEVEGKSSSSKIISKDDEENLKTKFFSLPPVFPVV